MKTTIIFTIVVCAVMSLVIWATNDLEGRQLRLKAEIEEIRLKGQLRNEYLKGFLDGASYQEVYRFHKPNTNDFPVIEIDKLMEEEMKAFDKTHGEKSLTAPDGALDGNQRFPLTNDMERVRVEA